MNSRKYQISIYIIALSILLLFGENIPLHSQSFRVVESNRSRLKLVFSAQIQEIKDISINGIAYKQPIIADAQNIITEENQGAPVSLSVNDNIITPSPSGFSLKAFKVSKTQRIRGMIYPNAEISTTELEYKPNREKYSNYINPKPIQVYYKGIAGERYIAGISLSPIKYDHASEEIEIITEAEIEIVFDEANAKYTNKKFEDFLISALNGATAPNWLAESNKKESKESAKYDDLQADEATHWGIIKIEKEGVYSLSFDDLNKIGFEVNDNNARTIRIYGFGGEEINNATSMQNYNSLPEQEFYLENDGAGKPNKIVFYAAGIKGITKKFENQSYTFQRYINGYSNANYYTISIGGKENPRINSLPAEMPQSNEMKNLQTYHHFIYEEEDLVNPIYDGSGRVWYGKSFFPVTITNKLYNLDRSGTIYYTVRAGQNHDRRSTMLISENDKQSGKIYLDSSGGNIAGSSAEFNVPAINIASDDRSILKITYDSEGNNRGLPYLDYYTISYPRSFNAIDNEINITIEAKDKGLNQITAVQFSPEKIFGWDISNRLFPKILRNYSTTPSIFIIRTETKDSVGNQFFLSSNINKAQVEKLNIANLRNDKDEVDMIMISHPDLQQSAEEYAKYRNSRGIKTKVYLTPDIYNEFGAGIPGPYSIRNFIAYKYNNTEHKPKFVYLWGSTHYDYRNIVEKTINYVPIFEGGETELSYDSATEEYYAYVSGDDYLMDVSVGRATISNNEEGKTILNKIKHYENNSSTDDWRNIFTLLADDSFAKDGVKDVDDHVRQSEAVASLSSLKDFQLNKIYSAQFPMDPNIAARKKSAVTAEMLNSCNKTGNLILNYIGHGNPRVWAHEDILVREQTISKFQNLDKMFFCYTATCDFGRYDMANGVKSGAEEMFKHKQGAAIALYSTLRSVTINENGALVYNFYKNLMNRDANNNIRTIGSITAITRNSRNSINGISHNDMMYCLIGDPSLKLLIPEQVVNIETINGVKLDTSTQNMELKGLEKVNVRGNILQPNGDINTDFNGMAIVNLFDASERITFTEPFGFTYNINKLGNALSKNSVEVKNGKFEINFIIPKDISFSDGNANLAVYAVKFDSSQTAMGSTNKINIRSISESGVTETNGPEINLFLENRRFTAGDLVSANPLLIVDLSDESGINTAGAGIGHRIEAWIDDNPESIDLTNLYKSSFTKANSGSIEKIITDLKPGMHTVKVRAWDVYNNFSVNYTDFKIGENNGAIILNTFMYPNPILSSGNISVTHSVTAAYDINIKMYDAAGKLVNEINKPGTSLNTIITEWDGRDSQGLFLQAGNYFYTIELRTKKETARGFGKFMVVK